MQRVRELVDNVASLGESVTRLRDSVKMAAAIGNAIGPAVAAAVRAFWERGPDGRPAVESTADQPDTKKDTSETASEGEPRDATTSQEEAR